MSPANPDRCSTTHPRHYKVYRSIIVIVRADGILALGAGSDNDNRL